MMGFIEHWTWTDYALVGGLGFILLAWGWPIVCLISATILVTIEEFWKYSGPLGSFMLSLGFGLLAYAAYTAQNSHLFTIALPGIASVLAWAIPAALAMLYLLRMLWLLARPRTAKA